MGKREEQKKIRKQLILEKGLELFVEKGYSATKISDIAEAVDMSVGLMFHYFESKEKLYEELLMAEEGLRKTAHEKIFIGKPLEFDQEKFLKQLEQLKKEAYQDGNHIRESVKEIVETYQYQETGEKSKKK